MGRDRRVLAAMGSPRAGCTGARARAGGPGPALGTKERWPTPGEAVSGAPRRVAGRAGARSERRG